MKKTLLFATAVIFASALLAKYSLAEKYSKTHAKQAPKQTGDSILAEQTGPQTVKYTDSINDSIMCFPLQHDNIYSLYSYVIDLKDERIINRYKPIFEQYWTYLGNIVRMDFGYSLNRYPATVTDIISQALPWTFFLLLVTTILSFIIGNLLGAISAWPKAPRWMRSIATPFVLLTGVPIWVYALAFAGGALWLYLNGRKGEQASVEAVQEGARR